MNPNTRGDNSSVSKPPSFLVFFLSVVVLGSRVFPVESLRTWRLLVVIRVNDECKPLEAQKHGSASTTILEVAAVAGDVVTVSSFLLRRSTHLPARKSRGDRACQSR